MRQSALEPFGGRLLDRQKLSSSALRQTRLQTLSIGVRRARMPTHAAADASGHAVKRRSSLGSICTAPPHPTSHTSTCTQEPAPVPLSASHFQYFATSPHAHTCAHTLRLSGRVRGALRGALRGQEVSCDEVAWMCVKPTTLSSACARAYTSSWLSERECENTEKRNG
jgi:hypothetical protein